LFWHTLNCLRKTKYKHKQTSTQRNKQRNKQIVDDDSLIIILDNILWYVVGGGGVVGCVVASLHSVSMFPLSSQIFRFAAWGPGVQPTGILHSDPAWFSVNC
jgi:hypothetical protein